jgi:polyferredoxin
MKEELTAIERIDLAARAESVEPFLSRAVLPMVFVTMMAFLLALGSQASLSERFAVWMYVLVAAVTVIMLLRHWCYAAYGLSILNFLAAIGILKYSKDDYSHTFFGSTTN